MTVLDPWAGSGTTCAAALLDGCHAVGYDLSRAYLELARAWCHEMCGEFYRPILGPAQVSVELADLPLLTHLTHGESGVGVSGSSTGMEEAPRYQSDYDVIDGCGFDDCAYCGEPVGSGQLLVETSQGACDLHKKCASAYYGF